MKRVFLFYFESVRKQKILEIIDKTYKEIVPALHN
jgi:hypothetical protein